MRIWRCSHLTVGEIRRPCSIARRAAAVAQVLLSEKKQHALHSRTFSASACVCVRLRASAC
eukprot:1857990-Alexandrium_andersonii.AAC.1